MIRKGLPSPPRDSRVLTLTGSLTQLMGSRAMSGQPHERRERDDDAGRGQGPNRAQSWPSGNSNHSYDSWHPEDNIQSGGKKKPPPPP